MYPLINALANYNRKIVPEMYIRGMTAEEWEAAFHGVELPDTLQLGPGMKINNVQEFLKKEIYIVKTGVPRVTEPVEWRLQKLLNIVNETNGDKE